MNYGSYKNSNIIHHPFCVYFSLYMSPNSVFKGSLGKQILMFQICTCAAPITHWEGWLSMGVCIGTTYLCNLFPFIKPGVALRILQLVTWKKLEAIAVALDCQTSRLLPGITGFALQNCLKLFALALCCRASCHLAISTSFSSPKKQSNSQLTAFTKHCCFLFRGEGES